MLFQEISPPAPPRRSSIDQQLCLHKLPTPVVALCSSFTVVFANQAAKKLLNPGDQIQWHDAFIGRQLTDLGITLLYDRTWDEVFDDLVSTQHTFHDSDADRLSEEHTIVHEVVAVVETPGSKGASNQFRILLSTIMADCGMLYILSFEHYAHVGMAPLVGPDVSSNSKRYMATTGYETKFGGLHDIQQFKTAVFDSTKVAGFIITADEKFYITNKRMRELLGSSICDGQGVECAEVSVWQELWDESFANKIEGRELPGPRLVRTKKSYADCRYGLLSVSTGKRYILNVSGECLYSDAGQFMGGVCWFSRFEELSHFLTGGQQQDLRSHETICNLLPHMVWTTTADGECDWLSNRWYEYTGLKREEAIGRGFTKMVHPDDLSALLRQLELNKTQNEFQDRFRFRRQDGCYRWMLARGTPIQDENGEILRWYGTNTDIHEATVARIHTDGIKDQIMAVLAHADISLFAINSKKIVTMAEGQALDKLERICGQNATGLVGLNAIDIARSCHYLPSRTFEKNLFDILAGEVPVTEYEQTFKDRVYRTRMMADLGESMIDDQETPPVKAALGLIIDVTDMKARAKLELDNTRLVVEQEAAQDSNRMKSQFLANMSHELRTPTSGVIGMVDLLTEDPTLSTEQRECINSIQVSAKALLTIVNDTLDFSKIESGRFDIEEEPFNLGSTVSSLCQLLTTFSHQKGVNFICQYSLDENLEILGDAGRIRQILSNLLMNALKFTAQGSVKISVASKTIESEIKDYETLEVQFVIEDTGIGIKKHVLDTLFTPYYQGDASTARLYGGTGLGLTISQNLARLMRGSITLTSTPTVGSTATLTLPLKVSSWAGNPQIARSLSEAQRLARSHPRSSTQRDTLNQEISNLVTPECNSPRPDHLQGLPIEPEGSANALTPDQRSRIHVLLVEDNAINQKIALKITRKLGFPVTAVWNGREALDYLLECSGEGFSNEEKLHRPDIILMDIQMPVMDGYEATRILRSGKEYTALEGSSASDSLGTKGKGKDKLGKDDMASLQNLPVIAMTASAIQGDKEKCQAAGLDDYLPKPVEKNKMEEMLVKWVRKLDT